MTDNLEEYDNPEDYDQEYGSFDPDGPFYLDLALKGGGPVLDCACGTGHVAIPMANHGLDVVGLDISDKMIERARSKSDRVRWTQADCRQFSLPSKKFRLIFMTGNAFQALLTDDDQKMFLACVRSHLDLRGIFTFSTRNPISSELVDHVEEETWRPYQNKLGEIVRVSGTQQYDNTKQIARYETVRRWNHGGQTMIRTTEISLRYMSAEQIEILLRGAGYQIENCYGDFNKTPLTPQSPSMIFICRLR